MYGHVLDISIMTMICEQSTKSSCEPIFHSSDYSLSISTAFFNHFLWSFVILYQSVSICINLHQSVSTLSTQSTLSTLSIYISLLFSIFISIQDVSSTFRPHLNTYLHLFLCPPLLTSGKYMGIRTLFTESGYEYRKCINTSRYKSLLWFSRRPWICLHLYMYLSLLSEYSSPGYFFISTFIFLYYLNTLWFSILEKGL